ncbi:MAG: 50S ribosomal protein L24 [Candidatus Hydrogenedentes bacterium CG1_02_42_14]|nr:MAG: 50S ribosomal protein L24 [Candidatus Hydrogenedentes bacterium CG1_02_42_14]
MACKIKKGMTVVVLSGKSKGKQGKILGIDLKEGKVLVEGVNIVKRATRPNRQNPQGGILEKESGLPISKVSAIDPDDKKPCRIKFIEQGGQKVRVSKRSGKVVEQ